MLHVGVPTPIDITEFWKKESMGVSVQSRIVKLNEKSTEERKELKMIV